MTTVTKFGRYHSPEDTPVTDLEIPAFIQAIQSKFVNFRKLRKQRQTVRQLRNLDSRTLSDIGIQRSEIQSVVYDDTNERMQKYDPR